MLQFLAQLSDNQQALLGCLVAIGASFGLLSISYASHAGREASSDSTTGTAPQRAAQPTAAESTTERKAA